MKSRPNSVAVLWAPGPTSASPRLMAAASSRSLLTSRVRSSRVSDSPGFAATPAGRAGCRPLLTHGPAPVERLFRLLGLQPLTQHQPLHPPKSMNDHPLSVALILLHQRRMAQVGLFGLPQWMAHRSTWPRASIANP